MQYEIEELELELLDNGKKNNILISCTIEITDYSHESAEPDVGIMSGSYTAQGFEIISDITIYTADEQELVLTNRINEPQNLVELVLLSIIKHTIDTKADWDSINERLTEYHQG